jgi:hypothetical protein
MGEHKEEGGWKRTTHEAVHRGGGLLLDGAGLGLAVLDGVVDEVLVRVLARGREDQRRVCRRILPSPRQRPAPPLDRASHLRLVHVDAYRARSATACARKCKACDALSKSPESETTTVPVCLSASSEVVMVDMGMRVE